MQVAERRHPQLPRDRLHHAVGRDLRPNDRIEARRQRPRHRRLRRKDWRWLDRRLDWLRRDDEGRAEEPIIWTAAAEASTEKKIVEGAAAHLAGEREGTGRRCTVVDYLYHRDAIRHRLCAGATRIGDVQDGIAGRAASVDDEPVRRRAVGAEKSVEPDCAVRTHVVARG